jgi:hypothetical protein
MGMTLWITTLSDRQLSGESDDLSLMYDLAEALDEICNRAQKTPLSAFFDTTDLEYNLCDESDDDDGHDEAPKRDPETGLAYGIDDMKWFAAADGISTLSALRTQLASGCNLDIEAEDRTVLLEEIDFCITKLSELPNPGKFHLAVVM